MIRDRNFRQSRRRDFDDDGFDPPLREFGGAPRFTATRFEAPSGPPVRAVVKWFKPERGFGFVELSDGSGDAFLHATVLERNGIAAVMSVVISSSQEASPTAGAPSGGWSLWAGS